MQPPLLDEERARLDTLYRYQILDTPPEQDFDDLTLLAAHICGAPIALISLIDADRLWFKSKIGLTVAELPRARTFCAQAITQPGLFVVRDTLKDVRFAFSPLVTSDPRIRFYAGTPLISPTSHALGTLCVLDRVPRELSLEQEEALQAIGRQVVTQLELRQNVVALARAAAESKQTEAVIADARAYSESIVETVLEPLVVLDGEMRVKMANRSFYQTFQFLPEATEGRSLYELGQGQWDIPGLREVVEETLSRNSFFQDFEVVHEFPAIGRRTMLLNARKLYRDSNHTELLLAFEDITLRKQAERHLVSQHAVSRILADSVTLAEAAPQILQAICENLGWTLGAFWCVDRVAGVLNCIGIWHKPSAEIAEFVAISRAAVYAPSTGFPSHVWANGKAMWVPDISKDSRFPRAPVAAREGLRAAVGFPVLIRSEVYGVMEFFSHETREPDEDLLNLMSTMGVQIGLFVLRRQTEESLRKANEELEVRVLQRTAQLAQTNVALKAEMSERERAEETLYRREREFSALVESAPDIIARLNPALHFTYISPAVEQATGLAAHTLIGETYCEMGLPRETCDRLDKVLYRVFATGRKESVEFSFPSPTGVRHYDTIAVPEFARDGSVESVIAISRDITERKLVENELRASEERFMTAFNASPDPMAISMLEDGRYIDVNESFFQQTGFTREEVIGHNSVDLNLWMDINDRAQLHRILSEQGSIRQHELSFRMKSGEVRVGLFSAALIEVGGVRCLLSVITDITQRKQAEEARGQLLRRLVTTQEEERRRLSRELHDKMGQHLSALTLGIHSFKSFCPDEPLAIERLQRLLKITDEVAQEAHQLAWRMRPAALDDVGMHTAISSYAETWAERAEIAADFHSIGLNEHRFPMHVETTVYRVTQEALTNILKHSQAQRVSIILEFRGDHLLLIVEDNGKGFDAKAALRATGAGRGLGLIGMQERVALVDGTLDIESSPGAGTTVFVRIPATPLEPGDIEP